jgi:surface antigen
MALAMVVTCAAVAGAGTTLHGPATPVVEFVTPALTPGARGGLGVDALTSHACVLAFSGPQHRRAGPFATLTQSHHVQWTWRVPANVANGRWSARVACGASTAAIRRGEAARVAESLIVRGARRHGGAGIVAARSLHVRYSATTPGGRPAATGGKVVEGVGAGGNPFPYGQCTYHAYETRPDVYDYAIAHGVPHTGVASSTLYGGIPDYWWNAWRWLSDAQRAGIPTGTTPVGGALVVFPRGYGDSAVGHIAYVVNVHADGTYLVSERNWNYDENVTERLVHPGYPGVGFIYGVPGGQPPPPVTTTTTTTTTSTHTTTSSTTTTTSSSTTSSTTTTITGPPPPYYVHHVRGTCADGSCGLHERTGPGYSSYAFTRVLADGTEIDIVCQTQGELVTPNHGTASNVWNKLTDGGYVSDVYTDTSGTGGNFSPPIPQC